MKTYVLDACAIVADSIAVAQAVVDNAIIVTSDHHELDAIDRDGKVKFLWIR